MTKFIAIISGKGGVGKTTTTLNIGKALVDLGKRVILLDANLTTPNLAIKLGYLDPEGTLNKFLRNEKTLKEITYAHESGVSIIPSSPSLTEYHSTTEKDLIEIFEHLDETADFVLVDAPSGVGPELEKVLKHCDESLIVINPNMSSVMDALKTIHLAQSHDNIIPGIVLNKSHRGRHELNQQEIEEMLEHQILANIKDDRKIRKATHFNMPLNYLYPRSRSAKQFRAVAEYLCFHR